MAQSGRSWNDSKSSRPRGSGSQSAGSSSPPGSSGGGSPAGGGGGRSSWRDKSAPAVAPRGKNRHWLVSRTDNPNRMRHRAKLAIGAAALLLLIGGYLVYVFFTPRNTPMLLIGVLDYAAPLPPNAWTAEDFDRFRSTFITKEGLGSSDNIRVYSDLGERQWRNGEDALVALKQQLADREFRPGGPGRNTVLIYLSGHGILNAKGRPCLVLATNHGNAEVWQPQLSRLEDMPTLDIQDALKAIQESYTDANVKKVVLLDCSRIQSNPRFGILENRFASELKSLQFKDENLFLLSSADAGQVGWALPDRGASAFGYYVCQGLSGRADDRQHDGNEDGIVTLDELERYLRKQVSEQVQGRYLAEQTPILLSAKNSAEEAAQIPLAWSHPEVPEEEVQEGNSPVAWSDIDKLWSRHYELRQAGPPATESTRQWLKDYQLNADRAMFYRGTDLLSWEAFQQGLLRLEQLNDAGRHYENEALLLKARLAALADELKGNADQTLPPALALRQVAPPAEVQQQVAALIKQPPKEPAVLTALVQTVPYDQRAKAAWNHWMSWARMLTGETAREDFGRTLAVLGQPPVGSAVMSECDPVEIRFLRLIDPSSYAPAELFSARALALRSAFRSRDLAEAAAWANDDVRAHYVVKQIVEQGDSARRRYEDQLFIQPASVNATGAPWKEAAAPYEQALRLAVEVSSAIDARDQAWQELPYLSQWVTLRQETATEANALSDRARQCKQLFAQNKELADKIDTLMQKCLAAGEHPSEEATKRFTAKLGEARKELVEATKNVRDGLDELLRIHRVEISDVREAAAGAEDVLNLRRIRDLLSTPLVTGVPLSRGNERGVLRDALISSRRNVQALVAQAGRARSASESAKKKLPVADHPLLALFEGNTSVASDAGRLSGTLRAALDTRFNELRPQPPAAIQPPERMNLTALERKARSMAALWTLNPVYRAAEKHLNDPLATVEAFDRHHAILWQAKRALDDFWGKVGDPRPAPAWYFDALATLALKEARGLGPGEQSGAYKAIDAALINRRQLADKWVVLNVPSIKLPPSGDRRRTVDAQPAINMKKDVPAGQATLLANRPDNQPGAMRYSDDAPFQERLPVTAPLDKPIERISFELRDPGLQTWRLAMFYRGHVVPAPLVFSPKEPGQLFVLKRAKPEAPRIMVKGDKIDAGAVTFIFDCSGSMEQKFRGVKPMAVAKPVMEKTFDELAEAGTYRVSLWLYGHRLGWNDKQKRVVTRCDFYGIDAARSGIPPAWCQPETMLMSEDVAREWPSDPRSTPTLTLERQAELKRVLDAVQGFGVTPLFYSIIKALQDEPNLKIKDAPRRLIVLTDGLNNVNVQQQTPRKRYRPEDVVSAMNEYGRGVQLHIVGFGEATTDEGDRETKQEAKQFQKDLPTIGKYHEIRNLEENTFNELLRKLIGLKKYEVRSGREVVGNQRVNREVALKDHRDRRAYTVEIVDSKRPHDLMLEGGEAIDLRVVDADSANPRLVHERFSLEMQKHVTASIDSASTVGSTDKKEQFFVGFHQPQRGSGYVEFPISIQNDDERQFSPRPVEAWVEITPIGATSPDKAKPLVFYDLEFVDSRPVPVLVCRASGWPAEARRARIELFFKMRPGTDPTLRREVREVEGKPESALSLSLPDKRNVRFKVTVSDAPEYKGAQITVTELCEREADVYQAKVDIETPADLVRREYFHSADQHEVQHDFIYVGKTIEELLGYRLRITSREKLESGAAKIHELVEVEVARSR